VTRLIKGLIGLTLIWSLLFSTANASFFGFGKKETKIPDWYGTQAHTDTHLLGNAEGSSLDHATRNALAEIAATLGVSMKVDTESTTTIRNGEGSFQQEENIRANVDAIKFSRYQLEKSAHDKKSRKYWVLVSVDKQAMSKDLKASISQLEKQLEADFNNYKKQPALSQVMMSAKLSNQLSELESYATTNRKLNGNYDPESILSDIRAKRSLLAQSRDKLQVKVEHDSSTKQLAKKVESMLNDQKIKVVSGSRKGNTKLVIQGDINYYKSPYDHTAKLAVNIKALDNKGRVLATSDHTVSGASPLNKQSALNQATNKMAKKFQQDGLLTALGL